MFKDKFNFNFWPSFADLMLSLVLVMLIILFVVSKMIGVGNENLDRARDSQTLITKDIKTQISNAYTVQVISDKNTERSNSEAKNSKSDITIINKLDRMTITFSDKVLFDTNESVIKDTGVKVLSIVGPIVKNNLQNISEIQVQGHADIEGTDDHNLQLASQRAINVYKFLQTNVGVNPAKYLMSATSFGKYKPVGREAGNTYSESQLTADNATEALMARNRRIEIVLFFKNEMPK